MERNVERNLEIYIFNIIQSADVRFAVQQFISAARNRTWINTGTEHGLIREYKIHTLKIFARNIGQCPRFIPVCPGVALRLFIPQESVETGTVFKKHFVGSTLLNAAILQNLNFVSVQHRRKSVSDHDRSSVFREATQSAENILKAKTGKNHRSISSYKSEATGMTNWEYQDGRHECQKLHHVSLAETSHYRHGN